jgi:hypothetical protein
MRNLAADLAHAVKKRELRDKMDEMLREQGDPRALGNASFFDAIDYVGPHGHSYDTWLRHNKP